MLEAITDFFQKLGQVDKTRTTSFDETDHRLAVAALLTHAMIIDGFAMDEERETLKMIMRKEYGLEGKMLDDLLEKAKEVDQVAVDFYSFTSVLKRNLDRDGLLNVVEMLWKVVLSDGVLHEVEDSLVWRIAELLGVETRERVRLRQKVENLIAD